ncbi:hypothetical protein J6590_069018 [Homalodisca vitripennis]|nr:hypothetical protein J6590_069018 [Homalodisca vitripennis]
MPDAVAPISAGPLSAEMTVNHGSSVHRHWSVQWHTLDAGCSRSNLSRSTQCRDDLAPISAGPLSAEMTVNHGSSVHRHWSVQWHTLDAGCSRSNLSRSTQCRDDREPRFQCP